MSLATGRPARGRPPGLAQRGAKLERILERPEELEVGSQAVRGSRSAASGGENEVLVTDPAGGCLKGSLGEVYAGHLGFEEVAATVAEGRDQGADAVRVDAPDGDFVYEGYERLFLLTIDEQRLARTPQGGWQVPDQGCPGEPRPDDNHAGLASDAHTACHRLTHPPGIAAR